MKAFYKGIGALAFSLVLLTSCGHLGTQKTNTTSNTGNDTEVSQPMMVPGAENKDGATDMVVEQQAQVEYVAYSKTEYEAKKGKEPVILFFHAGWCPSCKLLDKVLNEGLGELKGKITIYKTDYDTETALKKEFEITYQHTIVALDAEGNVVSRGSGENSLAQIQKHIDAALGI